MALRDRFAAGRPRAGRRSRRTAALGAVLMALLGPLTAQAGHQFSDVPDSHPFHREITAVAGAGITTGFADGTFRPSNDVTRQAMAAFFHRGAGRLDGANGTVGADAEDFVVVARATVDAGAMGGAGFVHLIGDATAFVSGATNLARCPCPVRLDLLYPGYGPVAWPNVEATGVRRDVTWFTIPGGTGGSAFAHGTVQAIIPAPLEFRPSTATYRLLAGVDDPDAQGVTFSGSLTATYIPLAGDGDATLARTVSCPGDDGFEPNDSLDSAALYYLDGGHEYDEALQGYPGERIHGALCKLGTTDWYRINRTLTVGERVKISARFNDLDGDIDLCLFRGRTQVVCAESSSDDELLDHTITTAGTHAVMLRLDDDVLAPGNTYTLQMFRSV